MIVNSNHAKFRNKKFDALVIGASFWGLLAAKQIASKGLSVCVLEGSSHVGGIFKSKAANLPFVVLDDSQAANTASAFLETLRTEFPAQEINNAIHLSSQITSYSGLKPEPFFGFGDALPAEYDFLKSYLSSSYLSPQWNMHSLIEQLIVDLADVPILIQAPVTSIAFERESKTTSLLVNGLSFQAPENLVIACSPLSFSKSIKPEEWPQKFRTRLAKTNGAWTSIHLQLQLTSPLSEDATISRFLVPGTPKEPTCCFAITQGLEASFLALIEGESSEDSEHVGNALRHMKRQIKKIHSDYSSLVKSERIAVLPGSHFVSQLSEVLVNGRLPQLDRFWFLHPQFHATGLVQASAPILASMMEGLLASSTSPCYHSVLI